MRPRKFREAGSLTLADFFVFYFPKLSPRPRHPAYSPHPSLVTEAFELERSRREAGSGARIACCPTSRMAGGCSIKVRGWVLQAVVRLETPDHGRPSVTAVRCRWRMAKAEISGDSPRRRSKPVAG
jgi:hypothetical protein